MRKLVVYSSQWCMPCASLKKRLTSKDIPFEIVDIEDNNDLCVKYGVRNIPTIFVFDGDKIVTKWVGNVTDDVINDMNDILNGKEI